MSKNSNHQIPAEVLLVASGNPTAPTTGSMVTSGNNLNIANQQLAVVSADPNGTKKPNEFLLTGADASTFTQVSSVKLVQGTPNSANINLVHPMGAGHKAVVASPVVSANEIQTISTAAPKMAQNGSYVLDGIALAKVDTTYTFRFDIEGLRTDHVQGDLYENVTLTATTPASLPVNPQDFILQNLLMKGLQLSQAGKGNLPFVMFGIDKDGSGSGVALSALSAGSTVTIATVEGVSYTYSFTAEDIATFTQIIIGTDLVTTSEIVTINPATTAPGSAATVDALIIMTLPEPLTQASDYVVERRSSIKNIGIDGGLTYVATKSSAAFEGQGYGRQVKLFFEKRARQQQYTYQNEFVTGMPFVQAPSYINEDAFYQVTIITSETPFQSLNSETLHSKKVVVALPATVSTPAMGTLHAFTVVPAATVTYLNGSFGTWAKSANDAFGHIRYVGCAAATPFTPA